jgi:hypothetical protein
VCWDLLAGDAAEARGVAADSFGHVFVVGRVWGNLQLDATHEIMGDAAGDGFVAGLGADGSVSWVLRIGATGAQTASAVAVDAMGNVIVGGYSQSQVTLGSVTVPPGLFAIKLSNGGSPIWGSSFAGGDGSTLEDITVVPGGDVIAGGAFLGTIDFGAGGSFIANAGTSGTASDAWFGRLQAADGKKLNGKAWGDDKTQSVRGVRVLNDNLYVAGTYQGSMTLSFGASPLNSNGTSVFLAKLSLQQAGKVVWQKSFGDTAELSSAGLAVDATGNVLVGGQFAGTISFDGTTHMAGAGSNALFAALYTPGGAPAWSRAFAAGSGEVHADFDEVGNVTLAGGFLGAISLDSYQASNAGTNRNVYVAKLGPLGAVQWLATFSGTAESNARGVATLPFGESVIVGGASNGTVNFGGGFVSVAGSDAFAVKVGQ